MYIVGLVLAHLGVALLLVFLWVDLIRESQRYERKRRRKEARHRAQERTD